MSFIQNVWNLYETYRQVSLYTQQNFMRFGSLHFDQELFQKLVLKRTLSKKL